MQRETRKHIHTLFRLAIQPLQYKLQTNTTQITNDDNTMAQPQLLLPLPLQYVRDSFLSSVLVVVSLGLIVHTGMHPFNVTL